LTVDRKNSAHDKISAIVTSQNFNMPGALLSNNTLAIGRATVRREGPYQAQIRKIDMQTINHPGDKP
jgi:hypothetical protein